MPNSKKWGQGGVAGGGTKYDKLNVNNQFKIMPEAGLNKHKANIKVDKPYDAHINGKK